MPRINIDTWNKHKNQEPQHYCYDLDGHELDFLRTCLTRDEQKGYWKLYPNGHVNDMIIEDLIEECTASKRGIFLCHKNGTEKHYTIDYPINPIINKQYGKSKSSKKIEVNLPY